MQNSIVKVSKCFNIFYTIFTQVLDKIENFEFPRNAQCLLSASLNSDKEYKKILIYNLRYADFTCNCTINVLMRTDLFL